MWNEVRRRESELSGIGKGAKRMEEYTLMCVLVSLIHNRRRTLVVPPIAAVFPLLQAVTNRQNNLRGS
jgi:hypothetical protein